MQEFDVIDQIEVGARGNFVSYVGIFNAAGALRSGSAELEIRADGAIIGRLIPGESIKLERAATRWTLTVRGGGYARVSIGMAARQFVGGRGIQETEQTNKSLRGTEWQIGARSTAAPVGFPYAAICNTSTDKVMVVSSVTMHCDVAATDAMIGFATIPAPVYSTAKPMNKYGGYEYREAADGFAKIAIGETASVNPDAGEMVILQESAMSVGVGNSRTILHPSAAGSPFILTPGRALFYRYLTAGRQLWIAAQYEVKEYGAR